ncbi:ABC transporter permease subunit, partial [candidate division GN15 bacterium]|nr:ABC transporter permease subunit [candidate division GN15 bacterium]
NYSPFQEPDIEFTKATIVSNEPRTAWEITFPQSLQWALIGVAAAFALSLVTERTRGTYLRLRLAPINRAHILAGKGLACFMAAVAICTLLMFIGILVFGVRVGWPLGLAVAIISAGICFTGIMMLISVIGKTEQAVGGAGWAIFLLMAMTGGGMVPLMAMPGWMLTVGAFSPVRWSITALEGAIWRGFTPEQMATPVGILLGVGIVCFSAGVVILARSER